MANRSGGASTSEVGRLQEARKTLEEQLGLPVSARITDRGLRLRVHVPAGGKAPIAITAFEGFPVEFAEVPKALGE